MLTARAWSWRASTSRWVWTLSRRWGRWWRCRGGPGVWPMNGLDPMIRLWVRANDGEWWLWFMSAHKGECWNTGVNDGSSMMINYGLMRVNDGWWGWMILNDTYWWIMMVNKGEWRLIVYVLRLKQYIPVLVTSVLTPVCMINHELRINWWWFMNDLAFCYAETKMLSFHILHPLQHRNTRGLASPSKLFLKLFRLLCADA